MNTASSSGTGLLPSNTVPNPRADLKAITTRSGVTLAGPSVSSPFREEDREPETIIDHVLTGSTNNVPPMVVQPSLAFTSSTPISFSKVPEVTKHTKKLSLPELTSTQMIFEVVVQSTTRPAGIAEDVFVKVGKFYFPTDFVVVDYVVDPRVPLILGRPFLRTGRALIDVYGSDFILEEIETFLQTSDEFSNLDDDYYNTEGELNDEEKSSHLKVLKSHKRTIAWKISAIKGIDPCFCTHKILLEDDFKPTVQYQRRVNPQIHEVIKKEVIKLLDAGLIYPTSDSPWDSPVHCVPKKGGMTVVENEDNELILTRLVMGWRVCIDYRKLNDDTRKDHFPLPFMDQMLERLARNEFSCFLDGFFGYFQIPIDPQDQEKTTFNCPYGTFSYRHMPFGLCNAPGTFQRCMTAIFHNMIEKMMEVFMDDFLSLMILSFRASPI
nr:reverse transcriptase domain-containing protein [Tanacetum cinerariifolium]